jgi:type IX secretion system PorP/SprF family membrane protein
MKHQLKNNVYSSKNKPMKKNSSLIKTLALALGLAGGAMQAQDVHFSQYTMSPLLLNPALSGLSAGDYRVAGNFRTQWTSISGMNTYTTVAGTADMAIGKVTRYNSFAGVGISFFYDQAGDLKFNSNRVDLNAAYHFMLNKRGTMSLSAGIQGSFNYRRIDPTKATFDSQYDQGSGTVDPNGTKENFGRNQLMYGDAGFGLFFSTITKSRYNYYLGFSLTHVNQPKISFYPNGSDGSTTNERLYMKFSLHGGALLQIKRKFAIIPHALVLIQGPAQQYQMGMNLKFNLSDIPNNNTAVYFGAQYRGLFYAKGGPVDAVIFSTRLDYKGFTIAASYDMNVSKLLQATNTVGGPEISVMYQGLFRKKPRPSMCPAL